MASSWGSEVANVEQATAWDGEAGERWADAADRYEAAGRHTRPVLLDASAIAAADQVLDIGCGTGASTREAARRATVGTVLGVDLSSRMLAEARRRTAAAGIVNASYLQADAQVHRFEAGTFDVAMSHFGAMFFDNPVVAFANVGRALRPGGRLALIAWRDLEMTPWARLLVDTLSAGQPVRVPPAGAPGPFGLAEESSVRRVLDASGFDAVRLATVEAPMYLGAHLDEALTFVSGFAIARQHLGGLDEETKARALARLRHQLADHAGGDGVTVGGSAWLVTARRP